MQGNNYRKTIEELLQEEIELADQQPSGVDQLPQVDLRTLLSELVALKSEVRVETQSSRDQRNRQEQSLQTLQGALQRMDDSKQQMSEVVKSAREQEMRRAALALVDIADRLESSLQGAAVQTRRTGRLFGGIDSMAVRSWRDGTSITLRRVEGYLSEFGVKRIQTVGEVFDPNAMEAVQITHRRDLPEGVVAEEITAGYTFLNTPLRDAQVIVNRRENHQADGIVRHLRRATEQRLDELLKLLSRR